MTLVEFLVPLVRDGSRRAHALALFRVLERELFLSFNGWTFRGVVKGCWRDPRTTRPQRDVSRAYQVAVDAKGLNALKSYLLRVKRVFDQQAIFMVAYGKVEFV